MADIKQAAKWMMDGKRVARKAKTDQRLELYRDAILNSNSWYLNLTIYDLLADDWEIAE